MRFRRFIPCSAYGPMLTIVLLGGCQRASYSFEPPRAAAVPVEALAAVAVVPVRAVDIVGAAPTQRWSHPAPPASRLGRSRQRLGAVVTRPATAVAALSKSLLRPAATRRQPGKPFAGHRPEPEPKPYHKGVAFALAVLLGFFGAHLFYLEHNRDGFRYLAYSLVGVLLLVIATPVAMSGAFGAGLGGASVAIFLLLAGLACIAAMYLYALLDAIRILTGSLAP